MNTKQAAEILESILNLYDSDGYGDGQIKDLLDDLAGRRRENLPPFGDVDVLASKAGTPQRFIDHVDVRRMRALGITYRRIAAHFRCSVGLIHKILNNGKDCECSPYRPGKLADLNHSLARMGKNFNWSDCYGE